MKRFLLLLNAILCFSVILNAQTIDVMLDGAAFSMISPNGQYIAGNIDDKAVYYNSANGYATSLEGEKLDDGGCFVWDINDNGQVAVDWKGQAAIWTEEEGYQVLVMPEGLEGSYSAARCITADGKTIVVSIGSPTSSIYLYTLNTDGVWTMTALPMPTEDPIFHQNPQFIAPMGINDAATRIMGRYRIDTGLEELPFTWEKDADGNWTIHWSAMEFICKGGKTDAVYPGEFDFDGSEFDVETGEWQAEYDKAWAEYDALWIDYEEAIRSLATGYYYSGKGSLSGIRMSKNGKYANVQISYEQTGATYPAVIDLDNDTVYVFTCRPGAGCLSVTNDGTVSLQGVMDYFSWTYVSSINDVTSSQTLTDYTLQRTNGALNLADYMTYQTPDGARVAEGTATFTSSGNGFVSWQYNGFGDNMRYETFIVRYDIPSADEHIIDNTLIAYPNPTNGIIYLTENMTNVKLFDVTGALVYAQTAALQTLDITHLPQGIYTLVATDGEKQIVNKIVKQ
jgi:WD40 repeat protein